MSEQEVYKYLAAKLDPSIMNIRLIGIGPWVPTEDIMMYGFNYVSVGVGATREIASMNISYLPFGGIRANTGDTITGLYASSGILYANVGDMVYPNAKEKYYERLENLLALGRGDLTEVGFDTPLADTMYSADFTTGEDGTIVIYGFHSGTSWAYIAQRVPWANIYPSMGRASIKSNGVAVKWSDFNAVHMPLLSFPASTDMRIGGQSEVVAKPPGHCNIQIWTYDIPADW